MSGPGERPGAGAAAAEVWAPPGWLGLWAQAQRGALPVALLGLVWFLPWERALAAPVPGGWAKALALLAAGWPAWVLGRGYARAVARGRRPAMWASFLWAGGFVWFGVTQAWRLLPEPGPALAVAWVTAWVAVMVVQMWKF